MATGRRIARDTVADLDVAAAALRSRDARRAAVGAGGAWLGQLQGQIRAAAGGSVVVPAYRVERAHISLEPGVGQGPPRVVSTLEGTVERSTYSRGSLANREAATPFKQSYELALKGSRFVIVADRSGASATPARAGGLSPGRGLEGHRRLRGRASSPTSPRRSGSTSARAHSVTGCRRTRPP